MTEVIAAQFETPLIVPGTQYLNDNTAYNVCPFPITVHNNGIKHNSTKTIFELPTKGLYRLSFSVPAFDSAGGNQQAFYAYFLIGGKIVKNAPIFALNNYSAFNGELLYDNHRSGTTVQVVLGGFPGIDSSEDNTIFAGQGTLTIYKSTKQYEHAEFGLTPLSVGVPLNATVPPTPLVFPTEISGRGIKADSTGTYFNLRKRGTYRLSFNLPSTGDANQLQFYVNNQPSGPIFTNSDAITVGEYLLETHRKNTQVSLVLLAGPVGFSSEVPFQGNLIITKLDCKTNYSAAQYVTAPIQNGVNLIAGTTAVVPFPLKTLNSGEAVKTSDDGLSFTLKKKGTYRISFSLPTTDNSYAQILANGAAIIGQPTFGIGSGGDYLLIGEILYHNTSRHTQISLSVNGYIGVLAGTTSFGNGNITFELLD
jgi:hypothetical protein